MYHVFATKKREYADTKSWIKIRKCHYNFLHTFHFICISHLNLRKYIPLKTGSNNLMMRYHWNLIIFEKLTFAKPIEN